MARPRRAERHADGEFFVTRRGARQTGIREIAHDKDAASTGLLPGRPDHRGAEVGSRYRRHIH